MTSQWPLNYQVRDNALEIYTIELEPRLLSYLNSRIQIFIVAIDLIELRAVQVVVQLAGKIPTLHRFLIAVVGHCG